MLELLDLPGSGGLPLLTTCPRCRTLGLHILADQFKPQQWHWCQGCGQHGNLVELAAAAWQLSPAAAVRRLVNESLAWGTPEQLEQLAAAHQPRLRLEQFRARAADSLLRGEHVWAWRVLDHHRLLLDVSLPQLRDTLGPLLGTALCGDAEAAFAPKSVSSWLPGGKRRSTSSIRLFRGNGWQEVVAVPLHDLPGRLSGFLFLGREGDLAQDLVSRVSSAVGGPGVVVHPRQQGLGESPLVALPDPWLLLKLQCRHARFAASPLPLAAWLPDQQLRQFWSHVRQMVFWWPQLTADVLRQAAACGGSISCTGPKATTPEGWTNYLNNFREPQVLLERVLKRAEPWPEAVNRLARQPDSRYENLLLELAAAQQDPAALLSQLDPLARRRAQRILATTQDNRAMTLTRGTRQFVVRETPQGYFLVDRQGRSALLANGRLCLHELRHDTQTDRTTFHGELLLGNNRLDVTGPLAQLQSGGFRWAQSQLLAAGAGLLTYDPAWERELLNLASQFHPPRVLQVTSRVGYDPASGTLRLPAGELGPAGWQPSAASRDPRAWPGGSLTFPSTLNGEDLQRLGSESAAPLWECLLAVGQLLEESFAGRMKRVVFAGERFEPIHWPILEALGCPAVRSRANNRQALQRLARAAGEHAWPVVALGRFPATRWAESTTSGVICHQRPWNALCRRLEGGWHIVRSSASEALSAPNLASCGAFLAAWLTHRAERTFRPLPCGVAASFRELLAQHGGQAEGLAAAEAVCYWDTGLPGDPSALPELIKLLLRAGLVELLPEGYASRKVVLLRRRVGSREYLGLPLLRLERLLLKQRAAWHRKKVLRTLSRHGVRVRRKGDYWYLPLAWWQQHWLQVRSA